LRKKSERQISEINQVNEINNKLEYNNKLLKIKQNEIQKRLDEIFSEY